MTLTEQCLSLPYEDRLHLFAELKDSLINEHPRSAEMSRGDYLLCVMADIIGEPVQMESRHPRYVWARIMVAYQLFKEGYTTTETGKMLGKNHTTIIHMRTRMEDALMYDYAYQDIIHIWKQFKAKLQNEIHRETN